MVILGIVLSFRIQGCLDLYSIALIEIHSVVRKVHLLKYVVGITAVNDLYVTFCSYVGICQGCCSDVAGTYCVAEDSYGVSGRNVCVLTFCVQDFRYDGAAAWVRLLVQCLVIGPFDLFIRYDSTLIDGCLEGCKTLVGKIQ